MIMASDGGALARGGGLRLTSHKPRWLSTEGFEFRESPDGVKMSEVVLKIADPLLKQFGDNDNRTKAIISLTIFRVE